MVFELEVLLKILKLEGHKCVSGEVGVMKKQVPVLSILVDEYYF